MPPPPSPVIQQLTILPLPLVPILAMVYSTYYGSSTATFAKTYSAAAEAVMESCCRPACVYARYNIRALAPDRTTGPSLVMCLHNVHPPFVGLINFPLSFAAFSVSLTSD